MTTRVAVPSKGRLRERVLELLTHAGYNLAAFRGSNASASIEGIEFIEMRPGDAAAWLSAGRLDAAFISTDTALENEIESWPAIELGFSRSDLVLACRDDAPYSEPADLDGKTIATHLPRWTARWCDELKVDVEIVAMGGSLEGICARGMADAIVDLRETGESLARNSLHAIHVAHHCEAAFVMADVANDDIAGLTLRIDAARQARRTQYLMLHIHPDKVADLSTVFPGLAAPTLLPLAGRDDLVAAHMVVKRENLWARLSELRDLGATGIVALPTDAIVQ
ncbi:MAG: ATP phosphoribosyltransferase [Acidobacteria bacterium]|nr:ATP phosphoribosyltransferase [Acidobacteriota bacterium]